MKKVVFRLDSSEKIGYGHLRRCEILASYLENDFEIFFLSKYKLKIKNIYTLIYNPDLNFEKTIEFCEKINTDLLVIDVYDDLKNIFLYQNSKKFKTVVFDDFCNISKADLIIRNNIFSKKHYGKILTGPNFYLLNDSLLKLKNTKIKFDFTFYGGDLFNKLFILKQLIKKYPRIKFCLLKGLNVVDNNLLKLKNLTIVENCKSTEVFKILKNSRISILPASGISMENYFLGGYTIMYIDSKNQQNIGDFNKILNIDLNEELIKTNKFSQKVILKIEPQNLFLNKIKTILQ